MMNGAKVELVQGDMLDREFQMALRNACLIFAAKLGRTLDIPTYSAALLDGRIQYDPSNGHLLVRAAIRGELNKPPERSQVELLAAIIHSSRAAALNETDSLTLAADIVRAGWGRG